MIGKSKVKSDVPSKVSGGDTPNAERIVAALGIGNSEPVGPGNDTTETVGKVRGPYKPREKSAKVSETTTDVEDYLTNDLCAKLVCIPDMVGGAITGDETIFSFDFASEYAKRTGKTLKDVLILFEIIKKNKDSAKYLVLITLLAEIGFHSGGKWKTYLNQKKQSKQTTQPKSDVSTSSPVEPVGAKVGY
jgi:hypothetical protein